MSNHQALVEALLMKSLLGYELVDTKFHLFSGRSAHPRKVTRLQALSANDIVLTARSEFFAELLSGTGSPDATFVDFDGGSAYEDGVALDDYGYDSDSDLEEEEEKEAIQTPDSDETVVHKGNTSESDDDDDDDLLFVADARSEIDSTDGDRILASASQAPMPITSAPIQHKLSVVNCRNILVRDTAFRTWKALLLYLYTNKIIFSPLKSQGQPRANVEAPDPSTLWPCSPKSMYRLACKVRLDSLRDQAFYAIRSSLNAGNILQELSSSLTSKYPAILQMQVDILLQHIASVDVIQNMPSLARRIADSQIPHGADIMIDLYRKMLLQYHPQALALAEAPTERESPRSDGGLSCRGIPSTPPPPASFMNDTSPPPAPFMDDTSPPPDDTPPPPAPKTTTPTRYRKKRPYIY
ncbi:hypothetical protein DEU56DRAFT_910729 [Suillus clintonianus]|uniref:uncharacterized protein n=1 Tax=Suillus clintonianus TaxID=1904413 RepID=UPI001B863D32|nr:uncharacterized protein DEU56DRAFT_910729 [Suillus clintonianus]KAG2143597.1 hypothetical protein DEU56DRAFT_910729 [Suillus clintonianus]